VRKPAGESVRELRQLRSDIVSGVARLLDGAI